MVPCKYESTPGGCTRVGCFFKHSKKTKKSAPPPTQRGPWKPPCPATQHAALVVSERRDVVLDVSNIVLGAMNSTDDDCTFSVPALVSALAASADATCLAKGTRVSGPRLSMQDDAAIWDGLEKAGFTCEKHSRDADGREDLTDKALHADILALPQSFADGVAQGHHKPGAATLVLGTGDGNAHDGRTDFVTAAFRAANAGMHVEVCGWRGGMSSNWAILAGLFPNGQVVIRELDGCSPPVRAPGAKALQREVDRLRKAQSAALEEANSLRDDSAALAAAQQEALAAAQQEATCLRTALAAAQQGAARLRAELAAQKVMHAGGQASSVAEGVSLLNTMSDTAEGKEACVAGGAVPALVAALTTHPSNPKIALKASRALRNIALIPSGQEAAVAAGAVPAVVAALRENPGNDASVSYACQALWGIAGKDPAVLGTAVTAGAVPLLAEAFSRRGDKVVHYTLKVLGYNDDGSKKNK